MSHRADRFTAVLDANVLAGALTRNVLLSLAEAGFFRPRWSADILAECERYVAERLGNAATAGDQRRRIEAAFPEGLVGDYENLIDALMLPDPKDCHVLAAAIRTKAALIVTLNLRDFPAEALKPHEVEAVGLDDFLADLIDLDDAEAVAALRTMRKRFCTPAMTPEALLRRFETLGLTQTADLLAGFKDLL